MSICLRTKLKSKMSFEDEKKRALSNGFTLNHLGCKDSVNAAIEDYKKIIPSMSNSTARYIYTMEQCGHLSEKSQREMWNSCEGIKAPAAAKIDKHSSRSKKGARPRPTVRDE